MECDPELRLSLCTGEDGYRNYRSDSSKLSRVDSPLRNQQQMTIFYDGRVCVCNATEMQLQLLEKLA
ncbi:hypothetical protein C4D60_Mb06t31990 [Musa balbisiana]|uniref:Tify domain-containing protein n=1 Tax=Musa balbisiana TaxID=52838 RepID=A0A4S8ISZ4_MUSBA|nr:hypothetical protein C4D60_Mb06t31990 [Musa balbisiana]